MLKLFHVTGTRSVRPLWLCFELDLAVEVHPIDFSQRYRDSPEWRAISPAGKVPVLADGDLTMFESGAMIDYILERYGEGRLRPPPGATESAIYHQWCWFSEATLARPLGLSQVFRSDVPAAVVGEQKVRDCLDVVEQVIAKEEFLLAGGFSAADIMMGYTLELVRRFELLDDRYPGALAYLDRLKTRDACRRAMAA